VGHVKVDVDAVQQRSAYLLLPLTRQLVRVRTTLGICGVPVLSSRL